MKVKKVKSPSRVQLFVTLWTVVYQAPPSMGFFRQEYWSGFPFLSPGDLPDPGIGPGSPTLQTDASPSEPPGINDESDCVHENQDFKKHQCALLFLSNKLHLIRRALKTSEL